MNHLANKPKKRQSLITGWPRDASTHFKLFYAFALCLLILSVVIPNSLPKTNAVFLCLCFILSIYKIKIGSALRSYLVLFYASVVVTVIYLFVGLAHDAPTEAIQQVLIIYIVSPLMWSLVALRLIQGIGTEQLTNIFLKLSFLCAISVGVFFYMYQHYGPESVSFFKETSNINLQDGYSGAIMYVYGSLIFLTSAVFAAPEIIKNNFYKAVLLIALLACAITSGRSALIMSAPIGLLVGVFTRTRKAGKRREITINIKKVSQTIIIGLASLVAGALLIAFTDIKITTILDSFFRELSSGGGTARSEQAVALMNGFFSNYGLGAGHGIGVSYIRSVEFPWRYELIWLATLYRVGVLGALVYLSVFVLYAYKVISIAISTGLSPSQKFLFGGFVSAFLASNTNPYIEAVSFQWMYIIPMISIFMVKKNTAVAYSK